MAPQTAVNDPAAGRFGQAYDMGPQDVVTGVSAEVIPYGRAVSYSAANGVIKLPAAGTDVTDVTKLLGIARMTQAKESGIVAADPAQYEIGEAVNVLRKGRIWVYTEVTCAVTDSVYIRYTADGATKLPGMFLISNPGAAALAPASMMKWFKGRTGAGLAVVEVNNP